MTASEKHTALKLLGKEKDLDSFTVRRVLPSRQQQMVGPFIFFDHMGPADFQPGDGLNVRPHPHIGLATITYMFEGTVLHQDSLGTIQEITPGAMNLMVAGKGIVHSERTPQTLRKSGQKAEGLQLWLALPEELEQCEPAFYHYPESDMPRAEIDGAHIHLLMGAGFGLTSSVKQHSPTFYAIVTSVGGAQLTIPDHVEQLAVYVVRGKVEMASETAVQGEMLIVNKTVVTQVRLEQATRIAIIGGDAVGERLIDWNFVATRKELIEQAKQDWEAQRFPKVSTDSEEWIPLPLI